MAWHPGVVGRLRVDVGTREAGGKLGVWVEVFDGEVLVLATGGTNVDGVRAMVGAVVEERLRRLLGVVAGAMRLHRRR
jgi:hypothetical protein